MAIADEVEPRPARAHAVACLALRHCVEGAGRTPLVCAACHCAAGPAAASKAIHARVRGVAAMRTALVAVGCVGVQGLRLEGRACVVAKGETEPTWARRRHARGNHFNRSAKLARCAGRCRRGNLSRASDLTSDVLTNSALASSLFVARSHRGTVGNWLRRHRRSYHGDDDADHHGA